MSPTEERLAQVLAGLPHEFAPARDSMATFTVARQHVREAMERLKTRGGFETNTLVTAVDRYPASPRFAMTWQFLSLAHNDRVRVHAELPDEDPRVATITDLWPGTSFSERECYDMFGIVFEGHPDLRRLLMPIGYEHFPLRKDFPHHGIEPDKLYRTWDRDRRKIWNPAP